MAARNNLYPVFLKLENIPVLIVGAGNVGYEKLSFMLKSSPDARVTILAEEISGEVKTLAAESDVSIIKGSFSTSSVNGYKLVIAATSDTEVNRSIYEAATAANILVNVADTPELCDFYLGSIVTKGDLKIAISTNGQSPTMAKRLRQVLEEVIPDDIALSLDRLRIIRDRLRGSFQHKVSKLNEITAVLTEER